MRDPVQLRLVQCPFTLCVCVFVETHKLPTWNVDWMGRRVGAGCVQVSQSSKRGKYNHVQGCLQRIINPSPGTGWGHSQECTGGVSSESGAGCWLQPQPMDSHADMRAVCGTVLQWGDMAAKWLARAVSAVQCTSKALVCKGGIAVS